MEKFVSNSHRSDPYKNFKFRISMDGRIVAGISDVTGLNPAPGSGRKKPKKVPGLQKFGNITLKRGLTQDTKFRDWINSGLGKPGSEAEAKNLRRSMILEYCNEAGEVIASYRVINGWPNKMEAPDLNAEGNEVAIETIELSYEGLELIRN